MTPILQKYPQHSPHHDDEGLVLLGRSSTLLRELADLVDDLVGGGLQPRRGVAGVRDRRGRYALSVGVKTAHFVGGKGCREVVEGRRVYR